MFWIIIFRTNEG